MRRLVGGFMDAHPYDMPPTELQLGRYQQRYLWQPKRHVHHQRYWKHGFGSCVHYPATSSHSETQIASCPKDWFAHYLWSGILVSSSIETLMFIY